MGVAKTSAVPDFCNTCQQDTPSWVDMNKKSQMVGKCKVCNNMKTNGALATNLRFPSATQLGGQGEDTDRLLPIVPAQLADVVPIRPHVKLPEVRVNGRLVEGRRGWAPDSESFPVVMTAEGIVERARAELARLGADIPLIEADLAAARAHQRGLAKMVAAYDRANPPAARPAVSMNPPARRLTRREALARDGG
jgi:hypothetical protein